MENPEAHLHPHGQAKLGELIAKVASSGVQVIVESHSDHILNGIRIAVRRGHLNPKHFIANFFGRDDQGADLKRTVTNLEIDSDGMIDRWPEGFFDEFEKELQALLEPRDGQIKSSSGDGNG